MSTRSQLRFVQRIEQDGNSTDDDRVAQVYRRSDGYPASVLRDLTQLKELLDATRAERGPAYTAATFVFLDKLSTVGLYLDGEPERTIHAAQPADLLEPVNMEHLDHPLFLRDTASRTRLTASTATRSTSTSSNSRRETPFNEPAEWTVTVSSHSAFPRWDGPTDESFERASWQFDGSLEHALEELVAEPA